MVGEPFDAYEAPSFDDGRHIDTGNVLASEDDIDVMHDNYGQVAPMSAMVHASGSTLRYQGRRTRWRLVGDDWEGSEDRQWYSVDPTVAYFREGLILLPVEMKLRIRSDGLCEEKMEGGNIVANREIDAYRTSSAPSLLINSSRVSLHAAFPPPPVVVPPSDSRNGPLYDESSMSHARRRLERYSGFYGAVGVTSATSHALGYADVVLSLNYRLPSLLSFPTTLSSFLRWYRPRLEKFIGNMHYNLNLGSTTKSSLGSTISTLDGRTGFHWDIGNPFYHVMASQSTRHGRIRKNGSSILSPSPQSDYTIAASHYFLYSSHPFHTSWTMKFLPSPPLLTNCRSILPSQLRLKLFNLTFTTVDTNDGIYVSKMNVNQNLNKWTRNNHRPKLSLSLGYGMPPAGGERLWMSKSRSAGIGLQHECGIDVSCPDIYQSKLNYFGKAVPTSLSRSLSLKLDAEHYISVSQLLVGTVEYFHSGQLLSIGGMAKRTLSSSRFSRIGVGVKHSFGKTLGKSSRPWWKQGPTLWLFQLERGDVRFLVPVKISPLALSACDSFLRVCFACMASIVMDIIVAELLCGVTSKLRLSFLKLLLGEENAGKFMLSLVDDDMERDEEDEERWFRQHLSKAQEDASHQVTMMMRQAKAVAIKEQEQRGLVIVKAVYGVIDNQSRQWIRRLNKCANKPFDNINTDKLQWHTMDATTQLQFWVTNSSLHLPAGSKKHMLGFYDMLAFISEGEWAMHQMQFNKTDERECDNMIYTFLYKWWKELWAVEENKGDLSVVLSVRYKWGGTMYDVTFYDDEAVDLPSQFAREVESSKN